jgi:hypothetical protein
MAKGSLIALFGTLILLSLQTPARIHPGDAAIQAAIPRGMASS